jgi:hypothetical protein
MHGVRPCRKTSGKQKRRDKRSDAPVAERQLFTDPSNDQDQQESAMRETHSIAAQLKEVMTVDGYSFSSP